MNELSGHLELTCSMNEAGCSSLSRQSFRAPFHVGKAYRDPHALVVQVINPTAGTFAGDRMRSEVRVERGARLHLSTPSANRVHTMNKGYAELHQRFFVDSGAWLEFNPASLIPQARSRYRQRTDIELEPGAELFLMETLAPGRVAKGESFAFAELDWELNVRLAGGWLLRERFRLCPVNGTVPALQTPFPNAYYAGGILVTERLTDGSPCWDRIRGLGSENTLIGVSRLIQAGWSIKLLARDSLALQHSLARLRNLLARELEPLRVQLRDGRMNLFSQLEEPS